MKNYYTVSVELNAGRGFDSAIDYASLSSAKRNTTREFRRYEVDGIATVQCNLVPVAVRLFDHGKPVGAWEAA